MKRRAATIEETSFAILLLILEEKMWNPFKWCFGVLIDAVELRRLFNEARQASGINRELSHSLMGFE